MTQFDQQTLVENYVLSRRTLFRALLFALVSVGSLLITFAYADDSHIYLEENGYVLFEAENASLADGWALNTDLLDYHGAGYLQWTQRNYFSKSEAGNGLIGYRVRINVAGNYELRWRSRIAMGDSNTESNDSWIRFPTGVNVPGEHPLDGWTKVFLGQLGQWSWSSRTVDSVSNPVRQYLDVGDHTIEISGRSTGHAIDRIALYRYDDVSFDAGLNGTLSLSPIMQADGTVVYPADEFTAAPAPTLDPLVNVEPQSETTAISTDTQCVANTLTLPAIEVATINLQDNLSGYDTHVLTSKAGQQAVLLKFNLSLVPPISDAGLHYTTGPLSSNGILDIYLGSHHRWPQEDDLAHPDSTALLTVAQGGWHANTRYESRLDASLLTSEVSTLILSSRNASDVLSLAPPTDATSAAQLVLSGGDNFCSTWRANSVAQAEEFPPIDLQGPSTDVGKSKGGVVFHGSLLTLFIWTVGVFSYRTFRGAHGNRLSARENVRRQVHSGH